MPKNAVTKMKPGAAITPVELAKRENVFRVYRDLGPTRSYKKLMVAIVSTHGTIATRTLNGWSKMHSWPERLREHDQSLALATMTQNPDFDPNYDFEEKLLHAAQIALTRALEANVTPANPHQQKALIDASINAVRIVELRRSGKKDRGAEAVGRKRVSDLLDAIEQRVRAAYGEGKVIDVEATEVVSQTLLPPADDLESADADDAGSGGIVHGKGTAERVVEDAAPPAPEVASDMAVADHRAARVAAVAGDDPAKPLTVAERLAKRMVRG